MKEYAPENKRNIAIAAHGGAGKTSLVEAMLFNAKATDRLGKVEDGTTVTDYEPEEQKRQTTITTKVVHCDWNKGTRLTLMDTPGYGDFIGEVFSALRVADGAVIVIDAESGVEVETEKVWDYCNELEIPRIILINKMDKERSDFNAALQSVEDNFGREANAYAVQLPIGAKDSFNGFVDVLTGQAYSFDDSGKKVKTDVPGDMADDLEEARTKLIESIVEMDEDLMNKYFEGEELSGEELSKGLHDAVKSGHIVPVLCGCANSNKGVQSLMDACVSLFPAPTEIPTIVGTQANGEGEVKREPKESEPFSALLFKTVVDPYAGKLSYFRVYSGTLPSDTTVYSVMNDKEEKIGHIFDIHAKKQTAVNKASVGDIVALAKMDSLKTGDTLCDAANVIKIKPPQFPNSMMVMGIGPKARGDEDKIGSALARVLEEDPTVSVRRDAVVKQTQISGMGELHLNVIMDKMKAKFGVEVALTDPKIPFQETIRATSAAQGKYKKQSGGRGQYGDCHIEFIPNPGGDFEFINDIFGGAIPAKFIPAVEKGLIEAMEKGYVAGYPIIGIKARLYDGSFHDVDSSENAFKVAASFAMKAAFEKARPCLLEPVMEVEVVIPEEYMGDVIGNINSKRGRVLGMEAKGNKQVVKALVPQMEMAKYAIELRSIARGRGYYSMKFSSYEEVPKEIEDKIVAEAEREKEQE